MNLLMNDVQNRPVVRIFLGRVRTGVRNLKSGPKLDLTPLSFKKKVISGPLCGKKWTFLVILPIWGYIAPPTATGSVQKACITMFIRHT